MDYEKKYKEALEKMRGYMLDKHGCTTLIPSDIFPELKESEDEKIRTRLIALVETFGQGKYRDEMLAYLERQKAKEKYDRMAPIYNDQESFEEALDKAWKFYNDSGASTVDGCEDNRIELAFAKGFREGFLAGEQKEQQPAEWSEEEAKVLDSIIDDYEKASKSFCGYDGKIGLLRAIRNSEYNLPKQEWSEEDEKILKDCIDMPYSADFISMERKKDAIRWLKSLRPHPHWKPSKKQMWALKWNINNTPTGAWQRKELESLYKELEKL